MTSFQSRKQSHGRVDISILLVGFLSLALLSMGISGCGDKSDDDGPSNDNSNEETLPDGFRENVPIYEPSKLSSGSEGQSPHVVAFTTPDSKEDVIAFYFTELKMNGWSTEAEEGDTRFSASNSDTDTDIVVGVTSAFDQTIFTITAYLPSDS